jgi:hypothetical protein
MRETQEQEAITTVIKVKEVEVKREQLRCFLEGYATAIGHRRVKYNDEMLDKILITEGFDVKKIRIEMILPVDPEYQNIFLVYVRLNKEIFKVGKSY